MRSRQRSSRRKVRGRAPKLSLFSAKGPGSWFRTALAALRGLQTARLNITDRGKRATTHTERRQATEPTKACLNAHQNTPVSLRETSRKRSATPAHVDSPLHHTISRVLIALHCLARCPSRRTTIVSTVTKKRCRTRSARDCGHPKAERSPAPQAKRVRNTKTRLTPKKKTDAKRRPSSELAKYARRYGIDRDSVAIWSVASLRDLDRSWGADVEGTTTCRPDCAGPSFFRR